MMRPIVREILDKQVVDSKDNKMGRVDGVVLELRPGKPPRVTFLEIGAAECTRRLSKIFSAWVASIQRRWKVKEEDPFRIPWSKVLDIGIDVKVDYEAEKTPADAWEKWIRDHIIKKIPGA